MHTLNVELSKRVMGIIHLMGTEISTDFNSSGRERERDDRERKMRETEKRIQRRNNERVPKMQLISLCHIEPNEERL